MNGSHEPQKARVFLGIPELAKYLGVSQSSIRRLIEQRAIPFYKLPRYIRFDRDDVEAYLATCFVKSMNEYEHTKD